jgi:hypothetical protein
MMLGRPLCPYKYALRQNRDALRHNMRGHASICASAQGTGQEMSGAHTISGRDGIQRA